MQRMDQPNAISKGELRKRLRQLRQSLSAAWCHDTSATACGFLTGSAEWNAAQVVMVFLSMPGEVESAPLALRGWQQGKTMVVPKVSWEQKRMLPVEIHSLTDSITQNAGVPEPISGNPVPINLIDLVVVPGLGFTADGHRIGRGMGFYDRFLGQPEFLGLACGLAFECQIVASLPVQDHDIPLSMLVTDMGVRRFAGTLIRQT